VRPTSPRYVHEIIRDKFVIYRAGGWDGYSPLVEISTYVITSNIGPLVCILYISRTAVIVEATSNLRKLNDEKQSCDYRNIDSAGKAEESRGP